MNPGAALRPPAKRDRPPRAEYRLASTWRIAAPIDRVYRTLRESGEWPAWWPGVERVVDVEQGADSGVGRVQHHVWKGPLPYRLRFALQVTRVESQRSLEALVSGEVEGIGSWTFSGDAIATTIRHDWRVRTTRRWMNLLAPVARPLFEWNHAVVMRRGERGLARRLGVAPMAAASSAGFELAAGLWAGFVAGIVATFAQMAIWWVGGDPVFATLLRDAALTAAIVSGDGPPGEPYGFDLIVMAVASCIHFALSLAYGCMLGWLIRRTPRVASLLYGAVFGLAVYAVNLHGFTAWFPWFAQSRGGATLFAHLVFGLVAAAIYRSCARVSKIRQSS